MKKWIAVGLALLALCGAQSAARAVGAHADGTTVKSRDGDGLTLSDGSKWRLLKGTSTGSLNTNITNPDRETFLGPIANVYNDTLSSIAGPTGGGWTPKVRDSLLVPVDIHNMKAVTFLVKMEGVHDTTAASAGGRWRIGFAIKWHFSMVNDTTGGTAWALRGATAVGTTTGFKGEGAWIQLPDSIYADGVAPAANVAWSNECVLSYDRESLTVGGPSSGTGMTFPISIAVPPGAQAVSFNLRTITASAVVKPIRIRVALAGRAL